MPTPTTDLTNHRASDEGDLAVAREAGRSRRGMLTGTAAAAAVAAVAGIASSSGTAGAADGDTLKIGSEDNQSTSRTGLVGPSFVVTDGNASGSLARNVRGTITGVHGFTTDSTANRAVWGLDETPDGVGVYGQHGATGDGTGVLAESGRGVALRAQGTSADLVLQGSGKAIFFSAGTIDSGSGGQVGTLARSDDGSLWYAVGDNDWKRLAGGRRSTTFTPIEPTRVYDSRASQPDPGPVGADGQRVINVRTGRDLSTGAPTEFGLVPPEATAVAYNLTVVRTVGAGFATLAPATADRAKASSINWTQSGQTIANAGIVQVDGGGSLRFFVGGPGGATDFIVDITGYYA